jgi:hypothetical protein
MEDPGSTAYPHLAIVDPASSKKMPFCSGVHCCQGCAGRWTSYSLPGTYGKLELIRVVRK